MKTVNVAKSGKMLRGKQKDMIFYCLMLIIPIAQFCIFYIGVNINSILLAFKNVDLIEQTASWTFGNFKSVWAELIGTTNMLDRAKTSILSYGIILCVGTPLGLLFSYYIYRKLPLSGAFRVILFLPSIISAIVMVTMFRFFVERAIPAFVNKYFEPNEPIAGLLANPDTRFATIMFYNIWIGFGTSVLMYANGMRNISPDVIESAHLDGATGFKEFWHICLPMIFPTISTFLITGLAGIFTNQLNLYSFYGNSAPGNVQTFGYYLYASTKNAVSVSDYSPLSALGIMMTIVVVPLTLGLRYVLEKFGPSED